MSNLVNFSVTIKILSRGCPSNPQKFVNKNFRDLLLLISTFAHHEFRRACVYTRSCDEDAGDDQKGKHWPWNPSKATSNGTRIVLQIWAETVILKIMRILMTVYWCLKYSMEDQVPLSSKFPNCVCWCKVQLGQLSILFWFRILTIDFKIYVVHYVEGNWQAISFWTM